MSEDPKDEDQATADEGGLDLDAELANLDIEKDYAFADSSEGKKDKEEDSEGQTKTILDDLDATWSQEQLARDEVFSKLYKPSKREAEILDRLASDMGAHNPLVANGTLLRLLNLDTSDPEYHASVLLRQGKVKINNGQDRSLMLFTHGFCISKNTQPGARTSILVKLISGHPVEVCHLYDQVDWVKDLWQVEGYAFSLQVSKNKSSVVEFRVDCQSTEEKTQWLQAWERVLLKNRSLQNLSIEEREARPQGWQHELLQTSLYTAAVTGQDFFAPHHLEKLNEPDVYNSFTPLHYAALHNQVHIIQHLVGELGADTEVKDEEGRTPMYYAERDNLQPAVDALLQGGAEESEALERERRGALISEARELEKEREEQAAKTKEELFEHVPAERRRSWVEMAGDAIAGLEQERYHQEPKPTSATEAKGAAQRVQSQMQDNKNLMHERGQKIEDLGDKSKQLEENATEYKDLAGQLRAKLENQNKGMNFLNPFSK